MRQSRRKEGRINGSRIDLGYHRYRSVDGVMGCCRVVVGRARGGDSKSKENKDPQAAVVVGRCRQHHQQD